MKGRLGTLAMKERTCRAEEEEEEEEEEEILAELVAENKPLWS